MFTLETALKLMQLAATATPMLEAIYKAAQPLLHESDQDALKAAYEAEMVRSAAFAAELQAEPIQPEEEGAAE